MPAMVAGANHQTERLNNFDKRLHCLYRHIRNLASFNDCYK